MQRLCESVRKNNRASDDFSFLDVIKEDMSKDIVTGIAITSLIFTAAMHMPIVGFFCALFIPLPVLFYRAKLGRTNGAFIPIGTMAAMLVVLGRLSVDVLVFSELMLLGFLLAEMFEVNLSVEQTILYVCGIVLLTAAGCLFFYSGVSNTGIVALISAYVAQNLELTLDLYRNIGVSEENIRAISESMPQIQYVLVRVIPAFAVVSSLFVAWTTLLLARPILKSRNLMVPAFGRLNQWRAPDHLVWGGHRLRGDTAGVCQGAQDVRFKRAADIDDRLFFSGHRDHLVLL